MKSNADIASATLDRMRRRRSREENTITYKEMTHVGAVLIEFSCYSTFRSAEAALLKAFPDQKFLIGIGEAGVHQIVLGADEQVTYFQLIANKLLEQ